MSDLVRRLRIKAGMIEMGEMIAWGSDSALMREAADALEKKAPDVTGLPALNRTREQWQKIDAKLCAEHNSSSANFYLIRDAQQDIERLHRALSQQSEPTDSFTAVDMATAAAQGFRDGQAAVEQAAVQDEHAIAQQVREALDRQACPSAWMTIAYEATVTALSSTTRPAQTEQQPVAVPEGWSIELGFDVLDRTSRFVESKSHTPTIKVILPACEPVDSSAWDLRDEVARRIGSVLATPDMDAKEA